MNDRDSIQALRRKVQALEEEFVVLAASTGPADVAFALDAVAIELHDIDRALYEAVFLRNDSEIRKLVTEIEAATQGGKEVLNQLGELKRAVEKVRGVIQKATKNVEKGREVLGEVDEMINLVKGAAEV